MKRIVLWLLSTLTVVVLLFGYHTSTSSSLTSGLPESSAVSGAASDTSGDTSGGTSGDTSAASGTYTGSTVQTRWGPVQVEITTQDGVITGVEVLQQPEGNHEDEEINAYALPILIEDTLEAQSADVDMVSGATVTSEGYRESLQAALDEAGL